MTFQQLTPSLACVQTPPPFISGVVVIQTLLGTVASDVFKLTFWNAGALQFLDNRFSGAVVGKLLVWAVMKQDPHIEGVHWAADCVKQWFIILGSIDYNCTFYRLESIATPPSPWNGIEIAF